MQGWPDSVKEVDPTVKPYWSLRDDVSVENGLVLLGSRVIVPESSRGNILQQIHGGYFGIEKCKWRAKSCVYWPSIYREIERLVNSCSVYQKDQSSQQKELCYCRRSPQDRGKPWVQVCFMPNSRGFFWPLCQVPICQKAQQPHNWSRC